MTTKHRLLIVDGNPYVADILVQTLKKDFTITVATNGQDAARLLIQGNRFDCVLTELNLSLFSGLELTQLIRTSRLMSHVPVIVLSNTPDSNTRIKCLDQGVDTFIAKPFNPLEVKAKLHALLRRTATLNDDFRERSFSRHAEPDSRLMGQLKSRLRSMIMRDSPLSQSA